MSAERRGGGGERAAKAFGVSRGHRPKTAAAAGRGGGDGEEEGNASLCTIKENEISMAILLEADR